MLLYWKMTRVTPAKAILPFYDLMNIPLGSKHCPLWYFCGFQYFFFLLSLPISNSFLTSFDVTLFTSHTHVVVVEVKDQCKLESWVFINLPIPVCLDDTFGNDCSLTCDDCSNGGKCNPWKTGCDCPDGWIGIICNQSESPHTQTCTHIYIL